ncbi:MAG: DNA-directed RNA polymerase subunit beta [Candidatus Kapaibacterium sp.]|nr:MAG: DNA-directed RNA polymerase subunit beta [Candidatus Kapabacteria bacterium]
MNGKNGSLHGASYGAYKERISFAEFPAKSSPIDLLSVQMHSYTEFLQDEAEPASRRNLGLQQAFLTNFPISDAREIYELEFIEYFIERPKYTETECRERELTYARPLKAKLRLSSKADPKSEDYIETIEQDVYLGNVPAMTPRGTFIINGAERVIVSQLHRSPGVFFSDAMHPNGTRVFSARIIPFRGSWVEFTTDIHQVMHVYIDRKKKFPVTMLLRALGYSSDEQILDLFNLTESLAAQEVGDQHINRRVAADVVDFSTGEIIASRDVILDEGMIEAIKASKGIQEVKLFNYTAASEEPIIARTLAKDPSRTREDALEGIYRQLRSGEAPDLETAQSLLDKLFFNPKRYDLGLVGRYRMNNKLEIGIDPETTTLTVDDIIAIIKYLIELRAGRKPVDDIDHLGNRRVRTVGEQLSAQLNVGLSRMARTIKERLNIHDTETLTPADLVNARTISSVINQFFGTNQLSQFMDQTNPLSEMTHKRRMSALGPGGLTRERAGFEVRDVHYTHYGRLCPIETPEGPNIGLISSLSIHARIDPFGFLETPYLRVENGKLTTKIEFLTAEKEEDRIIAPSSTIVNKSGVLTEERVKARRSGDFVIVSPNDVEYMDVATNQIASVAASLIPFLEHDDANRALMGSNMQRQAVPLLRPKAPLVGTGMEYIVAKDSRATIVAEHNGTVEYSCADFIRIRYDDTIPEDERLVTYDYNPVVTYHLIKFFRTNQDTCINQRPTVVAGQKVKRGEVLADSSSTEMGELALGRNVLVAFMPWSGYNFEDAIVISEKVVSEDIFTSIHIEEFSLQVRDTKRGEEELTKEIPNVSEEATKDLDEDGIVRCGADVREGDILIGKITPKGETDPTPEEKLLRAIFGDKAGDVKDASMKAPPGLKGVVINTKLFTRRLMTREQDLRRQEKERQDALNTQEANGIHEHNQDSAKRIAKLLDGHKVVGGMRTVPGDSIFRAGTALKSDELEKKFRENPHFFAEFDVKEQCVEDAHTMDLLRRLIQGYKHKLAIIKDDIRIERQKVVTGDELQPGIMKMAKVYVAKKRKLQVGDKMAGRHGNKGIVANIVPQEDMPFMPDGTPMDIVLNPLGVPSRMNLGQLYETALGWAAMKLGDKFASPIFDGASWDEVGEYLEKAGLPRDGKTVLYDGRTGETFDNRVTVGVIYMLKLSHLVDDKIHARSIGPYSLITQQPLGGKAQFGGQRFGEMEVWALEAYGAAHTLQEILTLKSDDVQGRAKAYEAVVKGENLPQPHLPESFNVLIRELQGLALEVRVEE